MAECMNCIYCDVYTDEDYCKKLICRKTSKRGRTITWMMCGGFRIYGGEYIPYNIFRDFADKLERIKTPKWCPKKKEHSQKLNLEWR